MQQTLQKERAIKLKSFLEKYGEDHGYDRTGFYQQILRRFRKLEQTRGPDYLKDAMGVQRSGGLWVGFPSQLSLWLKENTRPGPNLGVTQIDEETSPEELLASEGIYHLKEALKCLEPNIVTYWKVIGATRRAEDPAREVGVVLRNGVYVVNMPIFRQWYRANEP